MSLAQDLLNELRQEASVTRRFLEQVPFDKLDYRPDEKSEFLGRLAVHVAEILGWWKSCLTQDELDFIDFAAKEFATKEQLLSYFDDLLAEAEDVLQNAEDEDFNAEWSMRYGETVYFTLPKKQVVRTFCLNHWIHHRSQLGTYFRNLGIKVPATYGPSADDDEVILINRL
ncbi:MAG: hypothetical protein HC846_11650 [Blastocatellia bacterium]|nr:hypothetical protein [Blastocatellia bacterium]